MASILIVDDEPILARNVCDGLRLAGHDAHAVASGEEALKGIDTIRPEVVILDYRLPGINGIETLRRLRDGGCSAAMVMVTAHGKMETAIEAMRSGANDFLTKPIDLKELELVVERVLKQQIVNAKLNYFRDRERAEVNLGGIIGESEPMRQVGAMIKRIASSAALGASDPPSILITGETGTGKDLVARAIHFAGPRRDAQFVHINCTAIPAHLAESELFGHVKGSFTDARSDKRGLFEIADGGTLFLDEIGHMPPTLQAKLLYVLEHRTVRPIGGTRERKVDVHVIAATNRDLIEAIASGEFREDVYHRLRVLTVAMPPLRERGDDVALLAEHFLKMFALRFGVPVQRFSDAAESALRRYDWPGNVRELMHTIESAVLIADGPTIGVEHLNVHLPAESPPPLTISVAESNTAIELDFSGNGPKLEDIEHRIIVAALEHANHNLSRASRILGISRDAIRYRLDKYASKIDDRQAATGDGSP